MLAEKDLRIEHYNEVKSVYLQLNAIHRQLDEANTETYVVMEIRQGDKLGQKVGHLIPTSILLEYFRKELEESCLAHVKALEAV